MHFHSYMSFHSIRFETNQRDTLLRSNNKIIQCKTCLTLLSGHNSKFLSLQSKIQKNITIAKIHKTIKIYIF